MKIHIELAEFPMQKNRIKVAILGTGNIGTDLCERLLRDSDFEVVALVGRRSDSPGLENFQGKVQNIIPNGINGLLDILENIDGAFDATSAHDHAEHWNLLSSNGKWIIDLTPSKIGKPLVPELIDVIEKFELIEELVANYSMVTCGGQSSAPLLYAFAAHASGISEVEVSSSIAALSAGPATRRNIDEYIQATENLTELITGCESVKAILVLNPADPPIMMRTTVQMKIESCNLNLIKEEVQHVVKRIQRYVPGYDVVVEPHMTSAGLISATTKVTGAGYALPSYAGNLDIINAAAVETARRHANQFSVKLGN